MKDNYKRGQTVFSGEELRKPQRTDRLNRLAFTSAGVRHQDGVVLVTGTRVDQSPLMDGDELEEVLRVGEQAGVAASGRTVDIQQIAGRLRDAAVDDIERYGHVEDIKTLLTDVVEDVRFAMEDRAYGTALLLGGRDGDGQSTLYEISSYGVVTSWSAAAVGRNSDAVLQRLEDEYNECSSTDDYRSLCVGSVLQSTDLSPEALSVAEITESGYRTVPTTELETDTNQV